MTRRNAGYSGQKIVYAAGMVLVAVSGWTEKQEQEAMPLPDPA